MKKKETVKIAAMFTILTLYFIGFSYYGTAVYEKFFQSNERFDEGTMIGPESFDQATKAEALRSLTKKVTAWQIDAVLTFQYVEKTANISTNVVEFQIEKSIEKAVSGQKNELYTSVSAQHLQEQLDEQFPALRDTPLDIEMLASDIADIGDYLKSGETVIDLTLYMNGEVKQSIAAEVLTGNVTEPLAALIKMNPSIPVKSGDVVSFNQWLSSAQYRELDSESINILSSALYQLIMQTNFSVLEKNQSRALPDKIDLGYEARVDEANGQDFIFLNENNTSYTVEWQVIDGKVYSVLKGIPFYYTYAPVLKNKAELRPKTILRFSAAMPYDTMRVEHFGESGMMIDVFRQTREGALELKEEKIAEDFYLPVHQIEWHSSQDPPPETNRETEPDTDQDADSENGAEAESDPNTGTRSDAETESNPDKETESDAKSNPNTGTRSEAGKKSNPDTGTKTESKNESKTNPKTGTGSNAGTVPKENSTEVKQCKEKDCYNE